MTQRLVGFLVDGIGGRPSGAFKPTDVKGGPCLLYLSFQKTGVKQRAKAGKRQEYWKPARPFWQAGLELAEFRANDSESGGPRLDSRAARFTYDAVARDHLYEALVPSAHFSFQIIARLAEYEPDSAANQCLGPSARCPAAQCLPGCRPACGSGLPRGEIC